MGAIFISAYTRTDPVSAETRSCFPTHHDALDATSLARALYREDRGGWCLDDRFTVYSLTGLIRPPIRVVCAEDTAEQLRGIAEEITAVGTELLDEAVFQTWTELQGAKA